MRKFRTSGSVGAAGGNPGGDPTISGRQPKFDTQPELSSKRTVFRPLDSAVGHASVSNRTSCLEAGCGHAGPWTADRPQTLDKRADAFAHMPTAPTATSLRSSEPDRNGLGETTSWCHLFPR